MKKSAVLGIDPGKTGAICCLSYPKIRIYDYTSTDISNNTLICIKEDFNVQFAILEKVWFWNNERDVKTSEVLIRNSEMWATLLKIHEIPFIEVAPAKWRKGLIRPNKDKSVYIKKAKKLFPDHAFLFKRHDQAEAALIAYRAFKHVDAGYPVL